MRDIRNIIDMNVWSLEHKDKFQGCLDAINTIRKFYTVVDSRIGEESGLYLAYVEYGLYDGSNEEIYFHYDFIISYTELNNIPIYNISYTSELMSEYEELTDSESVDLVIDDLND